MSKITQRISDLTDRTIVDGEQVVRLVVAHHPNFNEPIPLEAKLEEIDLEELLSRDQDYVALSIRVPGDSTTHSILMNHTEFNDLFQQEEQVDAILERAREAKHQEEQETPLSPTVRRQMDLFRRRRILEARGIRVRKSVGPSGDYGTTSETS